MTAPDISQFELADPAPAGQLIPASAAARTAAGQSLSGLSAGRRPEFDVMRGFVVAGPAVFHSAVVFASGASWFVTDPRPSRGFTRLPAVGVIAGDAAAVPDLRDGRTVCDADPLRGSARPGAASAAAGPVRIRPGGAGSADVLYRRARAASLSSALVAPLAQLRERSRSRPGAADTRVVDIGRRQLRPRAPSEHFDRIAG